MYISVFCEGQNRYTVKFCERGAPISLFFVICVSEDCAKLVISQVYNEWKDYVVGVEPYRAICWPNVEDILNTVKKFLENPKNKVSDEPLILQGNVTSPLTFTIKVLPEGSESNWDEWIKKNDIAPLVLPLTRSLKSTFQSSTSTFQSNTPTISDSAVLMAGLLTGLGEIIKTVSTSPTLSEVFSSIVKNNK